MAIKTFKRVEKKYLLTQIQKDALETIVNEHMVKDAFCQNNERYLIRNIYFDTKNRDLIRKSIQKPYHKEKFRVRKYGNYQYEQDVVFLEIKKKTGGVVSKRRVMLKEDEAISFFKQQPIQTENYLDNQVLKELDFFLTTHKIYPTCFISYERMAYFDKDNKEFRLTFDSNLLYRRNEFDFQYHESKHLLPEDIYVLEIKIQNAMPLWLTRALSKLKIYSTSFSKYGKEYAIYLKEKHENVQIYTSAIGD